MQIPEANGVTKYFTKSERMQTLAGVGLNVEEDGIIKQIGSSGCGKATFPSRVIRFDIPDDGDIMLDGKSIDGIRPERTMVFRALFPWLDVQNNVKFGPRTADTLADERAKISDRHMEMMRLTRFDLYMHRLSTGMKKGAAVARTLVVEPEMLLTEEPLSALDMSARDRLRSKAQHIWKEAGKIFVTHKATMPSTSIVTFNNRPFRTTVTGTYTEKPRNTDDGSLVSIHNEIRSELHQEQA